MTDPLAVGQALARELGVNVRSLYPWMAGTRPDVAHIMLAIVEVATDRNLLDCLLSRKDDAAADVRQALLFEEDVWARLGGAGVLLDCLLSRKDDAAADVRQALLFGEDVWARLGGAGVERAAGYGDSLRVA